MNVSTTLSSFLIGAMAFTASPLALADEFDFDGFQDDSAGESIVRFVDGSTYDTNNEYADRAAEMQELIDPNAPPAIFAPSAVGIGSTTATIQWITDRPTDGIVYVTTFLPADPINGDTALFAHFDLRMGHSIDLSNLRPGLNYYYRIESRDPSGKTTSSATHSFITNVD